MHKYLVELVIVIGKIFCHRDTHTGNISQRFWSILTWKQSCCRLYIKAMMWIPCFTTSQRCSGDCRGHLNTVQSCSRFQFEVTGGLWYGSLFCWKQLWSEMAGHGSATRLSALFVLKGPKCANKHTTLHHNQPEPLIRGRLDWGCHVVYAKVWQSYNPNVAAENENH